MTRWPDSLSAVNSRPALLGPQSGGTETGPGPTERSSVCEGGEIITSPRFIPLFNRKSIVVTSAVTISHHLF